jgi:hypothetical protein
MHSVKISIRNVISFLFFYLFLACLEPCGAEAGNRLLPQPSDFITAKIPPRQASAMNGSQFNAWTSRLTPQLREREILSEFARGNIPPFLRRLKPVELSYQPPFGERSTAIIWVMPDYLSIGSDEDFVRIPMSLPTAIAVASQYGFTLPTRKMVDNIYRQADFRLIPQPLKPGVRMTSNEYYLEHNRKIEEQRLGRPLGELLSGHKKDLILTNRLVQRARRVAIYGWHASRNRPIQPLSTVHGARYADYSHGVRLVSTTVRVNGVSRSVFDVLGDPKLAMLLTYEGVIRDAKQLMTPALEQDPKAELKAQPSIPRANSPQSR